MGKISKKRADALKKIEADKLYSLEEAMALVKEVNFAKFEASVDLHIRLGVDPRKADQNLRGTITLPHGTGKEKKVLALCTPDKEEEAKNAGADHVGLDEYVTKIEQGWTDVDVIITMPTVMAKVGRLGRILGPRGLMPNPKTGTVTDDVAQAVKASKGGRVEYRADKGGATHVLVGKLSFEANKLKENAEAVVEAILKARPSATKGTYVLSCSVSSTMSPGLKIDLKDLA